MGWGRFNPCDLFALDIHRDKEERITPIRLGDDGLAAGGRDVCAHFGEEHFVEPAVEVGGRVMTTPISPALRRQLQWQIGGAPQAHRKEAWYKLRNCA